MDFRKASMNPGETPNQENSKTIPAVPGKTSTASLQVIRWIARVASLVSLAFLAMFLFGGLERPPTGAEWLKLAAFPFGVGFGMLLAWRHEILGGAVATGSIVVTYAMFMMRPESQWPGIWFLIFALPGVALLVIGLLSRRVAR